MLLAFPPPQVRRALPRSSEGRDVGLPCLGLYLELSPRIKSEKRKERPGGPTGNEFEGEIWPELRLILQMPSHRVGQRGCPALSYVTRCLAQGLAHQGQASGSG